MNPTHAHQHTSIQSAAPSDVPTQHRDFVFDTDMPLRSSEDPVVINDSTPVVPLFSLRGM